MTILVLAAHPDDEVLGAGGTISRHVRDGDEVHVAILGEGITSRYEQRQDADATNLRELNADSRRVADFLGAHHHAFDLPDNRFDTIPLLDITKIIERLIDEIQPELVFTQHGGDLNIDHVMLFRATLTATRPMADCPVRGVYAYEVNSSSEWAFQQFSPPFRPNLFVDIGSTIERKIEAMAMYESEARAFPHPRSAEALRAAARKWGSTVGVAAAEAFQIIRERR